MKGELLQVWARSWQEVWLRLSRSSLSPNDLFMELVSGLAIPPSPPSAPPSPPMSAYNEDGILIDESSMKAQQAYEHALGLYAKARSEYESALSSEPEAKILFRKLMNEVTTEARAIKFLETAFAALEAYGEANLTERFRSLVGEFIAKFSLRYEIRGPFALHTTIPGVFCKLISEIRRMSATDPHLKSLLSEFEEAFGDLKTGHTQAKIKSSLQKQFNLRTPDIGDCSA